MHENPGLFANATIINYIQKSFDRAINLAWQSLVVIQKRCCFNEDNPVNGYRNFIDRMYCIIYLIALMKEDDQE